MKIADDSLAPTPESKITNPTSNSSDDSRQPALDIDDEYSEDHKPPSSQGKSILGSNQVPPLDGLENQKRAAATAKNAGSPVPLVGVTRGHARLLLTRLTYPKHYHIHIHTFFFPAPSTIINQ